MDRTAIGQHTGAATAPQGRQGWGRVIAPALLLLLFAGQCVWVIRTQSLTYDEPMHIVEGLEGWRQGRFQEFIQNPPLARLWCTLPLLGPKWQMDLEFLRAGFRLHRVAPDVSSLAWRARAMNVGLGVLLGWLLWLAAAKLFSDGAANFALALFVFCPSVLAHFSLATTDGAAALLIFAAALQVVSWRGDPSWKRTLSCGVVMGLMLLTKLSALPMFAVGVLWMLALVSGRVSFDLPNWNWRPAVTAIGVALLVLWAGYFFHVSRLTIRDGTLTAAFPHWTASIVKPVRSRLNISVPVPAGEYIEGFRDLALVNAHGQRAFLLGEVSQKGGWKLYFPVAILLKWPLILTALVGSGVLLCLRKRLGTPSELWILASFPAVYLLLALFAKLNYGERHVLPIYPFALLFAAATWQKLAQDRRGKLLLGAMLIFNAADVLRYAPGYLSYMNVVIRPEASYHLLSDSNVDWGQGLLALQKYQREHPDEKISLAYFGSVDPEVYGIRAQPLAEGERVTGTVVVGATHLSGQFLQDPNAYRWLLAYGPPEILDGCLYVFHVPR